MKYLCFITIFLVLSLNLLRADRVSSSDTYGPFRILNNITTGYGVQGPVTINTNFVAPVNMSIQYNEGSVQITWNAVCGATSYIVYSSAESDGEFTIDNSGVFNGTSWTTAAEITKKFYYIRAVK